MGHYAGDSLGMRTSETQTLNAEESKGKIHV